MTDQLLLFATHDSRSLGQIQVEDPVVLVLADGRTDADANRAKGKLFESFFSHILARLGFEEGEATVNVKQDGVEIDIATRHRLTHVPAMVECKAYSSPLPAQTLTSFYGKVTAARLRDKNTFGLFVALPRTSADGQDFARTVTSADHNFRVMDARAVTDLLQEEGLIVAPPERATLLSDRAVVVTQHGIWSCAKELDPASRTARVVRVWSPDQRVPDPVLRLISASTYAAGLQATTFGAGVHVSALHPTSVAREPTVVPVAGSSSDFEYQLPASPRFFVGRAEAVASAEKLVAEVETGTTIVLNAQSGWGKSSLALRFAALVEHLNGVAHVVDTRTATTREYVWAVLRAAALSCEQQGVLRPPEAPSYASLASCLRTLGSAAWRGRRPLLIFFDQFENVFRDHALTAEFRDLALGVRELRRPIIVGFAWKTDFIGWTEEYPYHLRDDIRGSARVFSLPPFTSRDIVTLVGRLERSAKQKLSPELQERLREYSGGLPWLLKKLASHMLNQLALGATQERLASEALNAQALFDTDLAELTPAERVALHSIARLAPVAFDEIRDSVPSAIVQSLLNRRLIVQVGERIDTYWDVFRDYLNTGRVPIEDTYILRQAPQSAGRLIRAALAAGGQVSVADTAATLNTSENAIFNLTRDLRLLGILTYAPGLIRIADEVRHSDNIETSLRAITFRALRRHRAYRLLVHLLETHDGRVTIRQFTNELQATFPAVTASERTWGTYARAFAAWFTHAQLASLRKDGTIEPATQHEKVIQLLSGPNRLRPDSVFPTNAPGPAVSLLRRLRVESGAPPSTDHALKAALRDLEVLGAIEQDRGGTVRLIDDDLVDSSGALAAKRLRKLLEAVPGGREALVALEADPACNPSTIGGILAEASRATWSAATKTTTGKHFRGWARYAGVRTTPRPPSTTASPTGAPRPAEDDA